MSTTTLKPGYPGLAAPLADAAGTVIGLRGVALEITHEEAEQSKIATVLRRSQTINQIVSEISQETVATRMAHAGLAGLTCHQLRHTCLTRLREAGMPLEAVQAQAGHRSIESTRIYLHLTNDWLAAEYLHATNAIEADQAAVLDAAGGGAS